MNMFNDLLISKARDEPEVIVKGRLDIKKSDDDQRLAFGWASVAARADGEQIEDWDEDILDPQELERAVYNYVEFYRDGGEMHERGGVGVLIESIVFTKEKQKALGLAENTLPEGWWIGFHVTDADVWKKVKDGTYPMFSIEGTAVREEAEDGKET